MQSFFERRGAFSPLWYEIFASAQYDIASPGESPFREGFPCASSHNYGVTHREFLESAHIAPEMPQEVAVASDCAVFGYGYYKTQWTLT